MPSRRFLLVLVLLLTAMFSVNQSVYALTFAAPIRITTNTGVSQHTSVAAIGTRVYVAWQDDTAVSGSGTMPEIWLRVGS